jgi:PhnB protein
VTTVLGEFPGATPRLCVNSVDTAVAFYARVFGADELRRAAGPDGRVWHCELLMLRGRLLLVEEFPDTGNVSPTTLGGSPVTLHAYVDDVDHTFRIAIEAGATPLSEPEDACWGDRYAEFTDPAGHRWSIATQVEDQAPDEQTRNARQWQHDHGDPSSPATVHTNHDSTNHDTKE